MNAYKHVLVTVVFFLALIVTPGSLSARGNAIDPGNTHANDLVPTALSIAGRPVYALQTQIADEVLAALACLVNGNWGWNGTNFSVGLDQSCAAQLAEVMRNADVGVIAGQIADTIAERTTGDDLGELGVLIESLGRAGTRKASFTVTLLTLIISGIGTNIDEENGPKGVCIYLFGFVGTFDPTGIKVLVKERLDDCTQIIPRPEDLLDLIPVNPLVALEIVLDQFGLLEVFDLFGDEVEQFVIDLLPDLGDVELAPIVRTLRALAEEEARKAIESLVADGEELAEELAADARDEAEQLLADARDEAEQLLTAAREEVDQIITDAWATAETIAQDARTEAEQIVADAWATAETIAQDARTEAEQIVADAWATAETIAQDARTEAEKIVANAWASAETIAQDARRQAETIVADAWAESERIIAGARDFVRQLCRDVLPGWAEGACDF